MCGACVNVLRMSRMIQIRNVPDNLHRSLKVRAAAEGLSLSDYLLREMAAVAARPTLEEILDAIEAQGPVHLRDDPASAVRAERDAR
jgi:plasmid stability protein